MKAAIIVFTLFIFFSCKKSYTCECKDPVLGGFPGQTTNSFRTYKERKRSTAQGACTAYAAGTVGRTCALRD